VQTNERSAYSLAEVAQRAGISRASVYRAVASGALRTIKLGSGKRPTQRVTPADERSWLESLR
jgi:excisionase family DNA binding protein